MKNQPAPMAVTVPPAVLEEATGTDRPYLQQLLIDQLYRTLWIPEGLGEVERMARIPCDLHASEGTVRNNQISTKS